MNLLKLSFGLFLFFGGLILVGYTLWVVYVIATHPHGDAAWSTWSTHGLPIGLIGAAAIVFGWRLLEAASALPKPTRRKLTVQEVRQILLVSNPNGSALLAIIEQEPVCAGILLERVYDGETPHRVWEELSARLNRPEAAQWVPAAFKEAREIYGIGQPSWPKPKSPYANHMPPGCEGS